MENKYIIEGNKLIAEYLGWKEPSLEYKLKWCGVPNEEKLNKLNKEYIPYLVHSEKSEPLFIDSLQYELSWDSLMPVIEKIIKEYGTDYYNEYDMSYSESYFVTIGSDGKYCSQGTSKNSLIEATWITVVEFIKWYNNEQINNNR